MRNEEVKSKSNKMRARSTKFFFNRNYLKTAHTQLERASKTVMELPDRACRETQERHGECQVHRADIYTVM